MAHDAPHSNRRLWWVAGLTALVVVFGVLFGSRTTWRVSGPLEVLTPASAELLVSEADIALVAPGQPVRLRLVAYPGQTATGIVSVIASEGQPDEGGTVRFAVLVTLADAPGMTLRSGMTGRGDVTVAEDSLFFVWSGRATRAVMTGWLGP